MRKNVTTGKLSETGLTKLPDDYMMGNTSNYYFPINIWSVEDLLGKMLTHVEAMGLQSSAEKANKDLVRQTIWRWYESVQENSLSSADGCIGAIKLTPRQVELQ